MAGRDDNPGNAPETAEGDGFLGRWSRRKAEARTAEKTSAVSPETLDETANQDVIPVETEEEARQAFDVESLPDIDSLGPKSDFSVFMQAGVPAELKTKALRKLWRVKSELANLDGLIDYGEDLTGSFKVVDHLKTAYEVGRGFLRDETEEKPKGDDERAGNDILAENEEPAADRLEKAASETEAPQALSEEDLPAVTAKKGEKREA